MAFYDLNMTIIESGKMALVMISSDKSLVLHGTRPNEGETGYSFCDRKRALGLDAFLRGYPRCEYKPVAGKGCSDHPGKKQLKSATSVKEQWFKRWDGSSL